MINDYEISDHPRLRFSHLVFYAEIFTGVSHEDEDLPGIMTAAENVCYTLINVANDSEPPSEVSLKTDLGKHALYSQAQLH